MSESSLLKRLTTYLHLTNKTCKQLLRFKPPTDYSISSKSVCESPVIKLRDKDILTLEEAAVYLSTHPGTLLEEVSLGKLPGGKLAGQWHFCKWALAQHFATYHQPLLDEIESSDDATSKSGIFICQPEVVEHLLEGYARGERNFSGINLSGALLRGVSLPEINFIEGVLRVVDLRSSNLRVAEFQDANLEGAKLSGANLSEANLSGANLSHADLTQTVLIGANLKAVNFSGTNLSGAVLTDTTF